MHTIAARARRIIAAARAWCTACGTTTDRDGFGACKRCGAWN
jgi:hypothetical protein